MNSTTTRAISSSQNTNSAKPRISKKSANGADLTTGRCVTFDTGTKPVSLQPSAPRATPPAYPARRSAGERLLVGVEAGLGDAAALLGADVDVGR